jgi:BASS family bile acid:Na+ symporter
MGSQSVLAQLVGLAFQISIMGTVFGFGLRATLDDVSFLMRRPALLVRSLLAVFAIMPVVAVVLARVFALPQAVEIALVLLALSPMPPILPTKQTKAGGDKDYALGLLVVLAALSIVTIPITLDCLSLVFGRSFAMPPAAIAKAVLFSTLVPIAAGMLLRAALPSIADWVEKPVARIAKVLLTVAALALVISAAPAIWALMGNGTLLVMAIFATVGFLVGHVLGGPEHGHSTVLAFSSACRHPAIAFSMATANFPGAHAGAAILLYLIVSALVGARYLAWQRRHAAHAFS